MATDPYLVGEPIFYEALREALEGLLPGGEALKQGVMDAATDLGQKRFAELVKAADGPIALTDHITIGDATAGVRTLTLPVLATATGRTFFVKKGDNSGNAVVLEGDGAETIDGAANQSLAGQFDGITVFAGASEWIVISRT